MSKTRSTLFPNGVSNADANSFEGLTNYRLRDPTKAHEFFTDFDILDPTSEWNFGIVGTGTIGLIPHDGGAVELLCGGIDNDNAIMQLKTATFIFDAAKEIWYQIKLEIDDATLSDIIAGLWVAENDPITTPPSDGIFFRKDAGGTSVDFVLIKSTVETVFSLPVSLSDDTAVDLAFNYDGAGLFRIFCNDKEVLGFTDLTAVPDNVLMKVSQGVQNGSGESRTMIVDRVLVCKER